VAGGLFMGLAAFAEDSAATAVSGAEPLLDMLNFLTLPTLLLLPSAPLLRRSLSLPLARLLPLVLLIFILLLALLLRGLVAVSASPSAAAAAAAATALSLSCCSQSAKKILDIVLRTSRSGTFFGCLPFAVLGCHGVAS